MGTVFQSQGSFLCLQISLGYYFEWKKKIEDLLWTEQTLLEEELLP